MTALCHHFDCKYQHYFLNYQIFEHKNINNPNHHTHYPDHNRDGIGLGNSIQVLEPLWLAKVVHDMHLEAAGRYR